MVRHEEMERQLSSHFCNVMIDLGKEGERNIFGDLSRTIPKKEKEKKRKKRLKTVGEVCMAGCSGVAAFYFCFYIAIVARKPAHVDGEMGGDKGMIDMDVLEFSSEVKSIVPSAVATNHRVQTPRRKVGVSAE